MAQKPPKQPDTPASKSSEPPRQSYEKTIATWTIVLGFSTLILAIATIISAYFLYSTEKIIEKQVDAVRIQLRAYVGVGAFLFIPTVAKEDGKPDVPTGANVGFAWKNYGSTPANEFHGWLSAKWYANGVEPDFTRPADRLAERVTAVIGPGTELGGGPIGISITDLNKVMAREGRIFVWGRGEYRDSFPETPLRVAQFCVVLQLPAVNGPAAFAAHKTECNYSK